MRYFARSSSVLIEAVIEWKDLMKKRLEYDGLLSEAAREKWTLKRLEIILAC